MTTREAAIRAMRNLGYSEERISKKIQDVDALCLKNHGPIGIANSNLPIPIPEGETEEDVVRGIQQMIIMLHSVGPEQGREIVQGMYDALDKQQRQN